MSADRTNPVPGGGRTPWRPPTRRAFVAMLGAAAAALAAPSPALMADTPEHAPARPAKQRTIWIGHC